MAKRTFGERFEKWRENPVLVVFFFVSLFLSTLVFLVGQGIQVAHWYNDTIQWRNEEYAKLRSLRAGFTFASFKAELGTPVFSRRSQQGALREDSFRRRDYWVQAVSDDDGTVLMWSVTSCDVDFRPTLSFFGFSHEPEHVTLQRSTFDGVLSRSHEQDLTANYFEGVTANTYFYDEFYAGNPGNYKTYAWGFNDACPGGIETEDLVKRVGYPRLKRGEFHGVVSKGGKSVSQFRHYAVVNTYAETAPSADFKQINRAFQIGIDRILTRTVP